jgi:hypothetical protein
MKLSLLVIAIASALGLLFCALATAPISRAGTPSPEGAAAAVAGAGATLLLPSSEKQARHYSATAFFDSGTEARRTCLLAEITLCVWQPRPGQCRVKIRSFRAHKSSAKISLDSQKNMRQVPGTTYGDKKIAGRFFDFKLSPYGQSTFEVTFPSKPSSELKQASEFIYQKFLPMLFPPLPKGFDARLGSKWGKKPPEDALDTFSSQAKHTYWEVRNKLASLEKNPLVLLESVIVDNYADETFGRRTLYQRMSVHYDHKSKYVTNASFRRVLKMGEYEHESCTINEIPAPVVLPGPPKPGMRKKTR